MSRRGEYYDVLISEKPDPRRDKSEPIYQTMNGAMYCGNSEELLATDRFNSQRHKAQLVFTSPPFPLNTKKRYGNLQGDEYVEWFSRFAPLLKEHLSPNGSIVVEVGNAWEPNRPVMSTTVLKALLRFLEEADLNLCQEFVWYNSARLPSPIEWVNKERIRVKDSFTRIWWMSPVDRPKADNRRVLREYSRSMKKLIRTGKYNAGPRPSEHHIGKDSFKKNNNGAIPPNVLEGDQVLALLDPLTPDSILKIANTDSRDQYRTFCKQRGVRIHPARMPHHLVEFFLKFLTDEGDLVLDPFAGSNTTGAAAETLGRQWISIEAQWEYAAYSIGRFIPTHITATCPELTIKEVDHAAASSSSAAPLAIS